MKSLKRCWTVMEQMTNRNTCNFQSGQCIVVDKITPDATQMFLIIFKTLIYATIDVYLALITIKLVFEPIWVLVHGQVRMEW